MKDRIKDIIRRMKLRTKIIIVLVSVFAVWVILIQFQTYSYPSADDIDKRLNYLERVINEPLTSDSEIVKIGNESSYEFMLFSYSYFVYALTNLAVKDPAYKERVIPLIKECIDKTQQWRVYEPYGIDEELAGLDSVPDYSVLYLGHLNLMMGCYRLLSGDSIFNDLNDKISESLFHRYNKTSFLNLESYPSAIWIPDNAVAIASLKLHSFNSGSVFDSVCSKWLEYAKTHYTDAETGALCSTVDATTGGAEEEPRGSMLGWSIMFIYQFDSEYAIALYNSYKKHFSWDFLVFRLFKERHGNFETGLGDIDSGPLFFGYSIPANEFALGGSVVAGDFKTARKIERLINFGTSRTEKNNELKYDVRFIDMNISPMAEALVLNSLTITKWIDE
ncbi:MAG: hypothetical protein ACK5M3_18695 [Dysgonomonas sp.]